MRGRVGWRRWLFWTYAAVLLTLTHLPPAQINRIPIRVWDKAEHAGAYFVLAFLALWSAPAWPAGRSAWRVAMSIGVLVMVGAMDEWTQPIFGRTCEFLDWVADSVGVLTGSAVVWIWRGRGRGRLGSAGRPAAIRGRGAR